MRRILILGGTTEARLLAERLAARRDLTVTLSLAGRTAKPVAQPVPVRTGGFGGADGLAAYLRRERIDLLIDATHPYAATMSAHAAQAAQSAGVPLLALHRAPWIAIAGDRWIEALDGSAAARALGAAPRRVFLALGRNDLAPFVAAPQHFYLVRSVDPIDPPLALPHAQYVIGRGPFSQAEDHELLITHGIEMLVSKNSGGEATYGKIAAARMLGLTVIMLRRPMLPAVQAVESIADALAWIDHGQAPCADREV